MVNEEFWMNIINIELHKIFDFIRSLVGLLFLHEQRVKVVPARDLDDWRDNE